MSLISHIGKESKYDNKSVQAVDNNDFKRRMISGLSQHDNGKTKSGFPATLQALREKAEKIEDMSGPNKKPNSKFSRMLDDHNSIQNKFAKQAEPVDTTKMMKNHSTKKIPTNKINIAVTDDGISKIQNSTQNNDAISDVTSIIRQKLRDLPKF